MEEVFLNTFKMQLMFSLKAYKWDSIYSHKYYIISLDTNFE